MTKIQRSQEEPIIEIIDEPILPLAIEKFGKIKGVLIGGFLSGFLLILWLGISRIYQQQITD